jgi:hypothetical protein
LCVLSWFARCSETERADLMVKSVEGWRVGDEISRVAGRLRCRIGAFGGPELSRAAWLTASLRAAEGSWAER